MLKLGMMIFRRAAGYVTGMQAVGNGGGSLLMESAGYVMMEDGLSKILLE